MTFHVIGKNIYIAPPHVISIENLEAKTYTVMYDQDKDQYFLQEIENLTVPTFKIYGSPKKDAIRIFNTFMSRTSSTGAMFNGENGSGKTILVRMLSEQARNEGMPTIVVNEPFAGTTFNNFIADIKQECVIVFDEFEKVYNVNDKQNELLTLLDGTVTTKNLYLITSNALEHTDALMNRPSRMYYNITYKGLEASLVNEYFDDHLLDNSKREELITFITTFENFNFDMLQVLTKEVNMSPNDKLADITRILNIQPTSGEYAKFIATVVDEYGNVYIPYNTIYQNYVRDGNSFEAEWYGPKTITKPKLNSSEIGSVVKKVTRKSKTDNDTYYSAWFDTGIDIVEFDETKTIMSVTNSDGFTVRLKRNNEGLTVKRDYRNAF